MSWDYFHGGFVGHVIRVLLVCHVGFVGFVMRVLLVLS